jgi:glycerophosphoryl diester phosphodiesterase
MRKGHPAGVALFVGRTMIKTTRLFLAVSALALLQACGGSDPAYNTLDGTAPLVIGHRGASGLRPEHTLEAYQLAIEQGVDFIEPDLVLTKDGVMVARHEPVLDDTTDVSTKFPASRKRTRNLDGVATTAYFASDFTLAEIKTLRAVQPRATRNQSFNGLYSIPTLDEVIALAKSEGGKRGRAVGIYPEIKHSSFHAIDAGFGNHLFEDKLVAALHAAYGNSASAPVFIQSFEVANLQYLNTRTSIRLVQLIDANDVNDDGSMQMLAPYHKPYDFVLANDPRSFADLVTPTGLDFIKTYADAVGPWKPYLVKTVNDNTDRNGDGSINVNDRRVDGSTGVIENAHRRGLMVHTWTFRDDAGGYGFKDPQAEMAYYMKLGVDGVFTDFPATGVSARFSLR